MTPTQQTLTALMAQAGKNLGNAINGLNQPVVPTTQQTLTALMAQAGKNLGNAINGLNQPVIIKPLPPGLPSASTGTHDWVER
jgi:hypothetical protein